MLTLLLAQIPRSWTASDELATAARAVFATKCIQCHGPQVPHPKAAFGYITDLHRLVASAKYIVPGKPAESEIWKEISDGDMPPDEAKAGPLTQAESDAILAWIVGGAPLPSKGATANAGGGVWGGALWALAAGSLGWVHAGDGSPGPTANPMTIAGLHRWLGTGTAVLAPTVALIVERDARLGLRTPATRIAILALAA